MNTWSITDYFKALDMSPADADEFVKEILRNRLRKKLEPMGSVEMLREVELAKAQLAPAPVVPRVSKRESLAAYTRGQS